MAVTEIDLLESRLRRVEETLVTVDRRIAALEGEQFIESAPPVVEEPSAPPLFDFALIGRSVLIVGGAFLLRALTETGYVPRMAGVVVALAYSMAWFAIADRGLARGRRIIAVYDSFTAALILGSVIWEATIRFKVFTPPIASFLLIIAVLTLFAVAVRRQSGAVALIAAVTTTFSAIGLSIGTADLVPTALATAIIGVVALRLRLKTYIQLSIAIVSDFLVLGLIVMTALDRTPHSRALVELALLTIAALWVGAIESRPLWPGPIQTAAAFIICVSGASLLAFDVSVLAILWSGIAVVAAGIGRRCHRPQWLLQSPWWAFAAMVAAFTPDGRMLLPVVGVAAITAFILTPIEVTTARLVLLGSVALMAIVSVNLLLSTPDPAVLAMERSIILAMAAVLLALRGAAWPESAVLARVVLVVAALKFLVEDLRNGQATTIFAALAAYGLALVIIARHPTVKEKP